MSNDENYESTVVQHGSEETIRKICMKYSFYSWQRDAEKCYNIERFPEILRK